MSFVRVILDFYIPSVIWVTVCKALWGKHFLVWLFWFCLLDVHNVGPSLLSWAWLSCTLHFIRVVLSIRNMLRTSKIWCGSIQLQSQHLGGGCKMIILEKLARLFQNDNKIIMSTFELLMTLSHCLGDSCSSRWVFVWFCKFHAYEDGWYHLIKTSSKVFQFWFHKHFLGCHFIVNIDLACYGQDTS